MRLVAFALSVCLTAAGGLAFAKPAVSTVPASAPVANATQRAASEADLVEHGHYRNSSGRDVHSPAHTVSGGVPAGASAQCRDRSYSFSEHRRGTCSHYGGVSVWY